VKNNKKLILLICTGLGRVNRGFEQYISSLSGNLASIGFRVMVASGGQWKNPENVETLVMNTPHRDSWLLRQSKHGFILEQQFFASALLPQLLIQKPAIIYLGEYRLYCYLYKLRNVLGLNFKLCLYTGGQAIPGAKVFDPTRDYVHHITPAYLEQCVHLPANKQIVIPHFIHEDFVRNIENEYLLKNIARQKKIVLSIGLLDTKVKKMNLIVEVLGKHPEEWFPILLGATCSETSELQQLMKDKFGSGGFIMENVPHPQLSPYYFAADIFVSCSPRESFGLAMVEALYHGLPVVADDFFETNWVLGKYAALVNVTNQILLVQTIRTQIHSDTIDANQQRIAYAKQRFCWDSLAENYSGFFNEMLSGNPIMSCTAPN